jgi:hypothetical protein
MNFIIYFFVVILGYLTIAKSTNENYLAINSVEELSKLPETNLNPPSTVILISIRSHGNFIPSHYFRLKIVSAFNQSKIVHVRVPKNLVNRYASSLGFSIYNISPQGIDDNDTRLSIPGMYFIGNPQLGRWVYINNEEKWSFYKAYQHLPLELGWGNFRPSLNDFKSYHEVKKAEEFNPYTDLFGMNGQHTKKFLLMHMNQDNNNTKSMSLFLLKSYFNYKL